jgi:hypothetical protein
MAINIDKRALFEIGLLERAFDKGLKRGKILKVILSRE